MRISERNVKHRLGGQTSKSAFCVFVFKRIRISLVRYMFRVNRSQINVVNATFRIVEETGPVRGKLTELRFLYAFGVKTTRQYLKVHYSFSGSLFLCADNQITQAVHQKTPHGRLS